MDLDALRKQLIAAARAHPPSDRVPYAFEKRIMARLAAAAAATADPWALWGRVLWRAAAPCVGVMCATMLWFAISKDLSASNDSLAADLESMVLAPLENLNDSW